MKRLGGRQTRRVNALEQRTGALWEGRFKSSPIQADSYLLACCRYVELNPVRARRMQRPRDTRWSSYRHKVGLAGTFGGPDPDPGYCALGATPAEQWARYARFVGGHIPEGQWRRIRECLQRGVPTGNPGFTQELQVRLGRRLEHRRRGRPSKETR